MEQVISKLIDQFLREICGEGERRLKLQAFSACLEAVRGVRRLVLLTYFFCFACFLAAISVFAAGFIAVQQWYSDQPNFLDPRLIFSLGILVFSTWMLLSTVSEKRWGQAFRLPERIRELERSTIRWGGEGGISETDLARIIERIVDQKLKKDSSAPNVATAQDSPKDGVA